MFSMKRIRAVEETIASRYNEQKMRCPTHLSIGQEGIAAGVGLALNRGDFMMSTHRAHAHYLAKGGNLPAMIAEIYGKVTGCCRGKGGSMHLVDEEAGFMGSTAIVGNTIPVAVGLGLSIKLRNTNQVSCVFFGDGATEEGVFYESVSFAALKKLPVLFICENNFYSVYSPLRVRQPEGRKIHQLAGSLGLPASHGDGNDAVRVYDMVRRAVDGIRRGDGPQFLEFTTYRWREHCGPNFDNDIGYRTEDEYLAWKKRDPIVMLQESLLGDGRATREELDGMAETAQAEVDSAFTFAEQSPFPDPSEAYTGVFK